jgi:hypothetical protein
MPNANTVTVTNDNDYLRPHAVVCCHDDDRDVGDLWCCMVLRGVAWWCVVLRGVAWCCVVLRGVAWCCMVLHGAGRLRPHAVVRCHDDRDVGDLFRWQNAAS